MNSNGFALKKDVELMEMRLKELTPLVKHNDLVKQCNAYALQKDVGLTNNKIDILRDALDDYLKITEHDKDLKSLKTELTKELSQKVNK